MTILIHDGSFEGLLTSLYEALHGKTDIEDITRNSCCQLNLFSKHQFLQTDSDRAETLILHIKKKISPQALRHLFYAYLSEKPAGMVLCRYLKKGFQLGKEVDFHLLDADVAAVHALSKKVGREKHRLLGLTRFRLLKKELLYAPLEPDHDILLLLAPHFALRMPEENWIIHDVKRKRAALYNKKQWVLTDMHLGEALPLAEEEKTIQKLWQDYFQKIAIQERKNPRLQANFMPKKTWKYLVEKER